MKNISGYIVILLIFSLMDCYNKVSYNKGKEEEMLPIYGIWNPPGYPDYHNVYSKYGVFVGNVSSLDIWPKEPNEKCIIPGEIGIIYDIGNDIRIVGIEGKYPAYRIKFKIFDGEESLLNQKCEHYDHNAWIGGELIIHFFNKDEIWFEFVKLDLPKDNVRYKEIMRGLEVFIKFGKNNVYERAEKIDKPISLMGWYKKANYNKGKEDEMLPIYGIWNPPGYTRYKNLYTKYGLFKSTLISLRIWPREPNEKGIIPGEIGIIYDMGNDIRIVGIEGKYPAYRIKFKIFYVEESIILNKKFEYYDHNAWSGGELIIHFFNKDEIWFEFVKLDLPKDNVRYKRILKCLERLLRFGKNNVHRRAEKIDKPIEEM